MHKVRIRKWYLVICLRVELNHKMLLLFFWSPFGKLVALMLWFLKTTYYIHLFPRLHCETIHFWMYSAVGHKVYLICSSSTNICMLYVWCALYKTSFGLCKHYIILILYSYQENVGHATPVWIGIKNKNKKAVLSTDVGNDVCYFCFLLWTNCAKCLQMFLQCWKSPN